MIRAFERFSLLFLAGVVVLALLGAVGSSLLRKPQPVATAEAPARGSPADEASAGQVRKPADPPLIYDLEAVAAGAPVPRIVVARLPVETNTASTLHEQVITPILPLVLLANEEVLAERRQLWELRFNLKLGVPVPPEQRLWIEVLAERYAASSDDLDELASRVDVVPPSIVLALVGVALQQERREALERKQKASARPAKTAPTSGPADVPPWSKSTSRERSAMPDVADSPFEHVRAIVRALNTDATYKSFRAERWRSRQAGEPLDGLQLAGALPELQIGRMRASNLSASIIAHRLTRFDEARLQPSSPCG